MTRGRLHLFGAALGALLLSSFGTPVLGQGAPPVGQALPAPAAPGVVRGLFNWIHTTADSEKAFPFYRDVLGVTIAASPFGGRGGAAENAGDRAAVAQRIMPVSTAAPDPLIWDLTNTKGSRFRNVFAHAPNTPYGLELSEFFDIDRSSRQASPWDPGASTLVFAVRSLDRALDAAKAAGAPIVTLGGAPVQTPAGRAVVVRDPDGYLIELVQASAAEIAAAPGTDQVVRTSIGLTVANTARALAYYRDLLGFDVRGTRDASEGERRVQGLASGTLTQTTLVLPGTAIVVRLSEYAVPAGTRPAPQPFAWRIQDVGAPQFQLEVRDLDALIARTQQAGYRFLSIGAKPIQRAFGRFVFAIDPDGVLVEYVERSAR